ncbi:hypothetical protein RclHR1_22300004 [Rhizophagus clarus]|uniref:Reverse transcriptase domain-containing protein n=1 Tax=Rhizophagus clarus TaxID=94130 RepID=A0A2Z6QUB9_9GLOM|nr:hypothetical protein RclHR1_22300004 [Rhizophagus clarus]
MANVRPIALLEVIRKIFTKFISTQLSNILQDHNILCKVNYCGLKGESTASPIRLINNLIEDAKENSKELWIVLQDISKAFDSIIATAFGLSPSFQAEDGIDQGDSLSPLLWRIYYDPLLTAITALPNKGYNMECVWPHNPRDPDTWKNFSHNIAASAYMDDTAWIDCTQNRIQHTLDIARSFYELVDIKINHKKCELIIINPSLPRPFLSVSLGTHEGDTIHPIQTEARYLGVWISPKNTRSLTKQRIICT